MTKKKLYVVDFCGEGTPHIAGYLAPSGELPERPFECGTNATCSGSHAASFVFKGVGEVPKHHCFATLQELAEWVFHSGERKAQYEARSIVQDEGVYELFERLLQKAREDY